MEEEEGMMNTISDLIHQAQPLTAASSLPPTPSISPHRLPKPLNSPISPNPNPETLKPLISPLPLIGTLTLPSSPTNPLTTSCSSCFRFSDGTATVCCYVLGGVHPKMFGRKVRVLAWNFIPMKCGRDGLLEIIRWDFLEGISENSCRLSRFSSFCCTSGVCGTRTDPKAKSLVFGVVESVSPVSVVPCSSRESNGVNISGFLVNVRVCECKFCSSKFLVSELDNLKEGNVKDHCFDKTVIVYFCGLTSSWHPIVSTLIGDVVLILMLKKKLVFIGKDEPQLMYVAGDNGSLHVIKLFKKQNVVRHDGISGQGRSGSYTGVITGVYMQGLVVELDRDVMLLVTDQCLSVPHCMRVGAIVTLKNVHFVDPKFTWAKMLILGACCRTSMFVESFSPLRTGCYSRSYPPSLLHKFIDSLSFSARLWVLLVISCFKRKFVGRLSDEEILGSKHKEGMVQKYAGSYLAPSAFRVRRGVLSEFCKHDSSCIKLEEGQCNLLRLVLPIANLTSYCDTSWKRTLDDSVHSLDFVGGINQRKPLFCDGKFYKQSTRRVLSTDKNGILVVGTLKISSSSGGLQLVDATGSVDIMLDLPPTWDFDKIFEAKDFVIVMEGVPNTTADLNSTVDHPFSCRSIFINAPVMERLTASLYLYHDPRDEDARSDSPFFDWKRIPKELGCGKYHLLMLTHKFPFQKKHHGSQNNGSSILAEAIVLPFDLLITAKHEDAVLTRCHWKNSIEDITSHKRRKTDQSYIGTCDYASADARNRSSENCSGSFSFDSKSYSASNGLLELPCLIASKGLHSHSLGILHCTSECKSPSKVLLEFCPDSFCKYTVLKAGCCYLLDYQQELLSTKGNHKFEGSKLFIDSNTNLRSLNFSSIDGLLSSDVSNVFSFPKLHPNIGNQIFRGLEIPCLGRNDTGPNKSYLDVNVFVAAGALNMLLDTIKIWNNGPLELKDYLKEESDTCAHHGARITSVMYSSGPSCIDYPLPVGNLITLKGLVVGLHDCDGEVFPGRAKLVSGKGSLPRFLQGNGGICIHLLVEDCPVIIFCDSSNKAHPVGLGLDVHATFHRILVLSGPKKYMMLPVSFITINNVCLVKGHTDAECSNTLASMSLESLAFPNTVATELIYDVLESSPLEPRQFRCRVVAVYLLELERITQAEVLNSRGRTQLPSFGIPLAGFIMDDGSSSFCCWSESEKAATLLGLNSEGHFLGQSPQSCGNGKTGTRLGYSCRVSHLNRILEQHGRVVVKNYGSVLDSSCQDLAFSFGSNKSISILSEDILMNLVISPSGSFWTITGSVMKGEAISRLANRLSERGMALPSVPNVWATRFCRTDVLSEARLLLQEVA